MKPEKNIEENEISQGLKTNTIKKLSLLKLYNLLKSNASSFPKGYSLEITLSLLPIGGPFMGLGGLLGKRLITGRKFESLNDRMLYLVAGVGGTAMRVMITPQLYQDFDIEGIYQNIISPTQGLAYIQSKADNFLPAGLSKISAMICMNIYMARYEFPYIYKRLLKGDE